jgi:glucuronate isomerase
MSSFLTENFLLQNKAAVKLYHDYAKEMPIIDYHCHLPPEDVSGNRKFSNLTEIWLKGDHYKWRAMRSLGVDETLITGQASDYEKFLTWAKCVPRTIGNPLYHWTHLELKKPFGISDRVLNEKTAEGIWKEANEKLNGENFTAQGIIQSMNVKAICTTDDPADDLIHHKSFKNQKGLSFKMYPTFRPDKASAVEDPQSYIKYIKKLAIAADQEIKTYKDLLKALEKRHDFFHEAGCRLSDHGLTLPEYAESSEEDLKNIFATLLSGQKVSPMEISQLRTALFQFYGRLNSRKGWTMQVHIGAIRNNSSRMFKTLGPDSGFDSITDGPVAYPLSKLLDSLDKTGELPKTIIYNLNPSDNDTIATMIGNFQDGSIAGKIQFGSGWWFNDQKTGMEKQMESLANMGILSAFVGMLTDSRSLLSYTRHEYFRRILCNIIGTWVTDGEAPEDYDLLGGMVQDISYNNALNYFKFPG